jgi:aspartokinase-like uncharacterized kinase
MDAPALPHAAHAPLAEVGPLTVVKLGGSVVRSPQLAAWLDVITAAPGPIVVVPGGGALADEVRSCQRQLGFGDPFAHRMALLAMDQLAWAVAGLRPGLEVGTTEDALRSIIERGHVAVWAPYALISGRTDIEESWQLTSDSLALWLASQLGAKRCSLIKSIPPRRGEVSAQALAREGDVDEAFPAMLAHTGVAATLFGSGDQQALGAFLAGKAASGASIE